MFAVKDPFPASPCTTSDAQARRSVHLGSEVSEGPWEGAAIAGASQARKWDEMPLFVLQSGMEWNRVGRVEVGRGSQAVRMHEVGRAGRLEAGDQTVFLGEYQHTLDAKGRVSLPRKFRDEIGSRLVVSKGLESCLYVFSAEGHREFLDQLLTASDLGRDARTVRRFFTAGASEVEIDAAGRVALAPNLREFAGLTRDVVVTGSADHLEIWDAGKYAAYLDASASTIEDAADKLFSSGIL